MPDGREIHQSRGRADSSVSRGGESLSEGCFPRDAVKPALGFWIQVSYQVTIETISICYVYV